MKSNSAIKQFLYFVEYAGLRFFSVIFRLIPDNCVYGFANVVGVFVYSCLRLRRKVTMSNLKQALGDELSEAELKTIARKAYMNIGMTFLEMLMVPKLKDRILNIVDMSDIYIIRHTMENGRGVIFVSSHFGSWELTGASIAAAGIPFTVVAKRQSNPHVDNFINRYRTEFGMRVFPPGASIKHIVRALRKREAVGLISDQDAGRNGVFVSFFGQKASTPCGAAQLALKYGTPVIITMSKRTGNGRYKNILKKVEVREDDTVETLTQRFTTMMEDIIRQNPEQYFWMHRRWKTQPPSDTLQSGESVDQAFGAGLS